MRLLKFTPGKREQGSTLVVTLCICLVMGIVLASYLSLISSRHKISMRSTDWNSAMPVAEAGIEEALTHLQDDKGSPNANGWRATNISGQPVRYKQRNFNDGSYFYAWIYNFATNNPLIYSTGFVPAPLKTNQYISRTIRVGASNTPSIFIRALAATQDITMSGGGVVDGFDSRIGWYDPVTNRNASGGIGTDSNDPRAIDVGTAHVYGTVNTGPLGTVSVGGGAVGDVGWNASNTGIQPGYINNNMNVAFPSNAPPQGSFTTATITSAGGSNILFLPQGPPGTTNTVSSFTSSDNSKPMIVTNQAVLYVTGNFTVQGSGYVLIAPGGSLTLYVGGSTTTISGGGVVNGTQKPSNFTYFGLSSNTRIDYTGSAAFVGTFNAPAADVTISGSAGAYGAAIGKSFTISGGAGFHYDSSLGAGAGLIVGSWAEL